MKSALKVIVPLAVLVGLVFGVTFLMQYKPPDPSDADTTGPASEPPLRFFTSERKWEPASDDLPNRAFPAFVEPGEADQFAPFWFENRNTSPVVMQLKSVSCSSCSGGALAALPPDKTKKLITADLDSVRAGALALADPAGLAVFRAVTTAHAAADLFTGLSWQAYAFKDNPHATFEVPAGTPDPLAPQWGILNLTFKPRANPPLPLSARFATLVKGTPHAGDAEFRIWYHSVAPFFVEPAALNVGTFDDDTPPRTESIMVYSLTRGPGQPADLPPPAVTIDIPGTGGDPGKLVAAGTPEPLSEADRLELGEQLAKARKWPEGQIVHVPAAYRVPVTVTPKRGAERLDIGLLERDLWVTVPGVPDVRNKVALRGTVTGDVHLADGKDAIDLGSFKASAGLPERRFELYTTRPGLRLSVAKYEEKDRDGKVVRVRDYVIDNGRVADDVLKVTVEKQDRADPDREYYWVKVSVPPNAQSGNFVGSYVVLDVKGAADRRIRIPIKGGAVGR